MSIRNHMDRIKSHNVNQRPSFRFLTEKAPSKKTHRTEKTAWYTHRARPGTTRWQILSPQKITDKLKTKTISGVDLSPPQTTRPFKQFHFIIPLFFDVSEGVWVGGVGGWVWCMYLSVAALTEFSGSLYAVGYSSAMPATVAIGNRISQSQHTKKYIIHTTLLSLLREKQISFGCTMNGGMRPGAGRMRQSAGESHHKCHCVFPFPFHFHCCAVCRNSLDE